MSPEKKREIDLINEALHYRKELRRIYDSSICMLSAQIAKEALQYTITDADEESIEDDAMRLGKENNKDQL